MEGVNLVTQSVSEKVTVLSGSLVFLDQAVVLQLRIETDSPLDFFDIFLIESRNGISRMEAHVLGMLLVSEGQSGKDFKRRGSDSTLVAGRILEENDSLRLESGACFLCKEQIGSFDDVVEARSPIRMEESMDVLQIDSLRTASTRNEEISGGVRSQMKFISECQSTGN